MKAHIADFGTLNLYGSTSGREENKILIANLIIDNKHDAHIYDSLPNTDDLCAAPIKDLSLICDVAKMILVKNNLNSDFCEYTFLELEYINTDNKIRFWEVYLLIYFLL